MCLDANTSAQKVGQLTLEAIYPRDDGALVRQVPRYPPLIPGRCPSDEGRMEDQPVLGRVPLWGSYDRQISAAMSQGCAHLMTHQSCNSPLKWTWCLFRTQIGLDL